MGVERNLTQDFRTDEFVSERLGETPLEEAPERHPLTSGSSRSAGIAATLGALAGGALIGALAAGPTGALVGAAVGAVTGGVGAKVMAERNQSKEASLNRWTV